MKQLSLSIGEYSSQGRKAINQDFYDIRIPPEPLLTTKGIAIAIADGISSSRVSQEASKVSVNSFLEDYYSTSEALSVKKSAQQVIYATNSWIYAQNRQNQYHLEKDRGYVCTFTAMVIKSNSAYIFHVGDARIYRLRDGVLTQLTQDHRIWVSKEQSYLSRAMGIDSDLRIDYASYDIQERDLYLFMTDGVYEYLSSSKMVEMAKSYADDLPAMAKEMVEYAYTQGSGDNLTLQVVHIDTLAEKTLIDIQRAAAQKPFPPTLKARDEFDGYTIVRKLSDTPRSRVYLALDKSNQDPVVLKAASLEFQEDKEYIERFLLEEWIARKVKSAYLLKTYQLSRRRNYLYNVSEYIEGQTLRQWMHDNPTPTLEEVRAIAEQISKGLLAMHRLEMVHQDLRPENIMIDKTGSVKIIDFGSAKVKGIREINTQLQEEEILGTLQYSAPEYFLGEPGTYRSDLFSLAVIIYEMLSQKLPYGTKVARTTSKSQQKKLKYKSLYTEESGTPIWIDETVRKALQPDPLKRYSELSEFLYDLRHPNPAYLKKSRPPLKERNPTAYWQIVALIEALAIIWLLYMQS